MGLYHIENLTPEAKEQGEGITKENTRVYVIDDKELKRVKDSYPCIWKNTDAMPKLCFVGCPHLTLEQLKDWTDRVGLGLKGSGIKKVAVPTVFTASPGVLKEFEKTPYGARLREYGIVTSYICPLMYMNNPMCSTMPVITNSNKLRTYTSARYKTDEEMLGVITGKGVR